MMTQLPKLFGAASVEGEFIPRLLSLIRHVDQTNFFYFPLQGRQIGFLVGMVTFSAVLFIGVLQGLGIGFFLSLVLLVYHNTHPKIDVLGKMKEPGVYKNILFCESE